MSRGRVQCRGSRVPLNIKANLTKIMKNNFITIYGLHVPKIASGGGVRY